ncbi:MBL fold metallo-hydrolase [Chungangia koreensis]|uniref:MBL fold metallo-hydrolase n=1 Tax=Chungangia koreensis TaxID=752657 RepID=A0ABV8X135_9LACT
MVQIKMYPAKNGDCFLISLGEIEKKHILIDCGYIDTYENFLKRDLVKIAECNEKINLMIVTHIDSDHISGAIKFIEDNNKNKFIEIDEVWFNAYRHLQSFKKDEDELQEIEKDLLEREIALGKSHLNRYNRDEITKDEISAKQGSTLGALLLQGNYNWNGKFNGGPVVSKDNKPIYIDEIKINLLSPDEDKLNKLEAKWVKELKKKKWNFTINKNELFDDAYEYMQMMYEDDSNITVSDISRQSQEGTKILEESIEIEFPIDESVNNGSSIAILIKSNETKLLFLADAHPNIIIDKLREIGEENFDLVKVSHHGSLKNTNYELASNLQSTKYLFSTNGFKHLHPDPQTIIKLLAANPMCEKQLYFNYKTETSNIFESTELQNKYNYKIITGNGEMPIVIEL